MNRHSDRTGSLLDELAGRAQGRIRPQVATARWAPTVRKLDAPIEDIEDVVSVLDAGEVQGVRRSKLMERYLRPRAVDTTESGLVVFEGRRCCLETMAGVQRQLHHLSLPYPFQCDTCGTTYVIESQMR